MSLQRSEIELGPEPDTYRPRGHEYHLHNIVAEIPDRVLYSREEAIEQWGVNGDVLAVITLPGNAGESPKRIGVIDYGEFDKNDAPYAFTTAEGPLTFMGRTKDRYALMGLHHIPKDLMVAYLPLLPGETELGRNRERESYLLGLSPTEDNVAKISKNHLTVGLDVDGRISISDHSTNGTVIEIPLENTNESTPEQDRPALRKLGDTALERTSDMLQLENFRLRALQYLQDEVMPTEPLKKLADSSYDTHDEHIKAAQYKVYELAKELIGDGDDSTIKLILEFVAFDSMEGVEITPVLGKMSNGDDIHKKARVLEIYLKDPDVAKLLVMNKVGGFHGTCSAALPGILRQGALLSAREARARGETVAAGEQIYGAVGGNDVISFADYREPGTIKEYSGTKAHPITANDLEHQRKHLLELSDEARRLYGEDHPWVETERLRAEEVAKQLDVLDEQPDSEEAAFILDNFPVAFGVSTHGYEFYLGLSTLPSGPKPKNSIVMNVPSDKHGEFIVVDDYVTLDRIPVIAVPREHISQVEKALAQRGYSSRVIDIASIIA